MIRSFARFSRSLVFTIALWTTAFSGPGVPLAESPGPSSDLQTIRIVRGLRTAEKPADLVSVASFRVEIAADTPSRRTGLTGRDSMPEDHGMLFILNPDERNFFWMKGMRFPLDIVFFSRNRKVVRILNNLQPCEECRFFLTDATVGYVVEINGGVAEKLGITVGDMFVFGEDR